MLRVRVLLRVRVRVRSFSVRVRFFSVRVWFFSVRVSSGFVGFIFFRVYSTFTPWVG